MGIKNMTDILDHLESMTKEEFYQKILRGVASSMEFSTLMSLGIHELSKAEKILICEQLSHAGLPSIEFFDSMDFDEDLTLIAHVIASRAIKVQ